MEPIIIDLGSGFTKAGFLSDDLPSAVIPSFVGYPRRRYIDEFEPNGIFVGDDAIENRDKLSIYFPVEHGHIEDWASVESIVAYIFEQGLNVEPIGRSVLIAEPAMTSDFQREHIAESFFEVFDIEALNVSMQGVLSLYATGQKTGLVVEIGEGVTQIIPIHDGYTNKSAIRRSDFGGLEITLYLQKLLCDKGYMVTTRDDIEHVRLMKETFCFVSSDFATEESRSDLEVTYELPDGMTLHTGETSVSLGHERYYCTEILFDPRTVRRDNDPLHDLIWQSVESSSIEIRKNILNNVVLSGGTTLLPGLQERLEAELKYLAPKQARSNVKVNADENRLFGVWIGGKIFCSTVEETSQQIPWITKERYYEQGPSIVHLMVYYQMLCSIQDNDLKTIENQVFFNIKCTIENNEYESIHPIWLQEDLLLGEDAQYEIYNPKAIITEAEKKILEQLSSLLKVPINVFWSHILFDGNLQIYINSYLLNCKRNYDLLLERKWDELIGHDSIEKIIEDVLSHHAFENRLQSIIFSIINKAMDPLCVNYTSTEQRVHKYWLAHSLFRLNKTHLVTDIFGYGNTEEDIEKIYSVFTYICDLYPGSIYDQILLEIGSKFIRLFDYPLPKSLTKSYNYYIFDQCLIYVIKLIVIHVKFSKLSEDLVISSNEDKPYRKKGSFDTSSNENDTESVKFDTIYQSFFFMNNFEIYISTGIRVINILMGYIAMLNEAKHIEKIKLYEDFLLRSGSGHLFQVNLAKVMHSINHLYFILLNVPFSDKLSNFHQNMLIRLRRSALRCILLFYFGSINPKLFINEENNKSILYKSLKGWSKCFTEQKAISLLNKSKSTLISLLNDKNLNATFDARNCKKLRELRNTTNIDKYVFENHINSHYAKYAYNKITEDDLLEVFNSFEDPKECMETDFFLVNGHELLKTFFDPENDDADYEDIMELWNCKKNLVYVDSSYSKIASPLFAQMYATSEDLIVANAAKIKEIKNVFQSSDRHYTDSFLEQCLEAYNGIVEEVIDALLNKNLVGGLQDIHGNFLIDQKKNTASKLLQPMSFVVSPDKAESKESYLMPVLSGEVKQTIIDLEKLQQKEPEIHETVVYSEINHLTKLAMDDEPDQEIIGNDFVVENAQFGFDSDSEIIENLRLQERRNNQMRANQQQHRDMILEKKRNRNKKKVYTKA